MDLKDVEAFIALAKREGVSELAYEHEDTKLKVKLGTGERTVPVQDYPVAPREISPEKKVKSQYHEIKSPFVGTFYKAPSPGAPNYVEVGEKVSVGQTLCIIEAMKIMNEIDSDISGEIVEICVENEGLVEFDQVLFKIKA